MPRIAARSAIARKGATYYVYVASWFASGDVNGPLVAGVDVAGSLVALGERSVIEKKQNTSPVLD